jgi:drug/metabolite transporter (DMT)-like permease
MAWILFPLAAHLFYVTGSFIDKYLLQRYFPNGKSGALLIFGAIMGVVMLPVIWFIEPHVFSVSLRDALLLVGSGVLFNLYLLPYLAALSRSETSVVGSIFQTIPIFGFILGFIFLGEFLSFLQIVGGLIIIMGAVAITLHRGEARQVQARALFLMLLASFCIAAASLLFKFAALETTYWVSVFWQNIGLLVFGVILFAVPNYRTQCMGVIKKASLSFGAVNLLNEIIAIVAGLLILYAYLLAPIALVQTVGGFQPFFFLLFGLVLTKLFPHIFKESIDRKSLGIKIVAMAFMVFGAYLLYNS